MAGAQPEKLETVGVDDVSALARDLADDRLKTAVLHLDRPAAGTADDVVVVLLWLACHVGVLARGQIESLKRAELGEQVESAKDRGASDLHAALAGLLEQVGGGEVTRSAVDQLGHCAPCPGRTVACDCQVDIQCHNAQMILSINYMRNRDFPTALDSPVAIDTPDKSNGT